LDPVFLINWVTLFYLIGGGFDRFGLQKKKNNIVCTLYISNDFVLMLNDEICPASSFLEFRPTPRM
jgi:hypothetical protein